MRKSMCSIVRRISFFFCVGLVVNIPTVDTVGNTLSKVLELYGTSTEAIDVENYQKQLHAEQENYIDLFNNYHQDRYIEATKELAIFMEDTLDDPVNWYSVMETDLKYLESLVAINADLEDIFIAEADYRLSLADYNSFNTYKQSFDIDTYSLSGTTTTQINNVVDSIKELESVLMTGSAAPDIGEFGDLKSPTVGSFRVTSEFGYRSDPFTGALAFHNGLDLGAVTGTDVITLFGGQVIKAGDFNDGYGKCVLVSHVNEFQTFYTHLDSVNVKVGDNVSQYDKIGEVGSTGRSTGPHLHLGVYINERAVDPMFLFSKG